MRLARTLCGWALATPCALALAHPAYPERPVALVSPFPAGGATDLVARVLGQKLSTALGQPFIVENRAGATGLIGESYVMRARPDGHTLLIASNSSHVLAPLLQPSPPYDPLRDFAPIAMLGSYPLALKVNPKVRASNVAELIALAKQQPGKLNFGSVGVGSITHLAGEQFRLKTGTEIAHIPYKGTSALATALMSGEIEMQFDSVGSTKPLADTGRVRVLAVTGDKRSPLLPNVSTLAEQGVPGVDAIVWIGAFAPRGTPAPVISRLSQEIRRILNSDADVRRVFTDNGLDIVGSDPQAFSARIRQEQAGWKSMIASGKVQLQ